MSVDFPNYTHGGECGGLLDPALSAREQEHVMPDVTIKANANGPFLVTGPVQIVDHLGNTFTIDSKKPAIALCRCGHSSNRPFCDGSHKECGFQASETAQ